MRAASLCSSHLTARSSGDFNTGEAAKSKPHHSALIPASLFEKRERSADAFKRGLANGGPANEAPRSPSFEAVAREYVEKQAKRRVPRYRVDAIKRLEANVFGALGKRPISDIEAPELLAALRVIEVRGAHEMAARVRSLCSQVFRYGVACGYCKRVLPPRFVERSRRM